MFRLEDVRGESREFEWNGKVFTVPDPADYTLATTVRIGRLSREFNEAGENPERQFQIMREQLRIYVPGFTDEDIDQLTQRQLTELLRFLTPKAEPDPIPADVGNPATSAGA